MVTEDEAIRRILNTLSEVEAFKGNEINIEDLKIASNKFINDNNISKELSKIINNAIDLFEDIKGNQKFDNLMKLANNNGIKVLTKDFKSDARGLLAKNKIGLSSKLSLKEATEALAHELAHIYLHHDKGDTIISDKHEEYEEQANRTANLIIDLLNVL
ncbi:ImmA/IrrE family metallo-endopeptidase [Intestinibacter sp.]